MPIKNKTQIIYDVVIVNYNGEEIISSCLNSIYSSAVLPSKIIIYDNASVDKSVKIIKEKYPNVILILGKENLGFGRANNEAMRRSDADFILFMNNDVILDKNCSKSLLEGFNDSKLAILNPIIYKGWDKSKSKVYAFGAKINRSGFGYGLYDTKIDRMDLNCFSGACFMAQGEVIKAMKFEKSFFLYCEEPELSVRVLKADYKIGRISKALCYHLESYSSPKKNIDGTAFRQYYGVQNRWFILGKHWPWFMFPEVLVFNIPHLLYVTYFYIRHKKFSYLKLFYIAPLNLIRGLLARDTKKAKNPSWYKKLGRTAFSAYLELGKKVFADD